jgi:hypothetical protein
MQPLKHRLACGIVGSRGNRPARRGKAMLTNYPAIRACLPPLLSQVSRLAAPDLIDICVACSYPVLRKTGFLSHLYIKTMILPRQARDKHRENSKKDAVFRTERLPAALSETL